MRNFIFYVRKRFGNVYEAHQNSAVPIPGITLLCSPGAVSISKYNNVRQGEFRAIFSSYSKDREEAYTELLKVQESLLDTDREFYIANGYEPSVIGVGDVRDLTFIESSRNLYRFEFDIKISYERRAE